MTELEITHIVAAASGVLLGLVIGYLIGTIREIDRDIRKIDREVSWSSIRLAQSIFEVQFFDELWAKRNPQAGENV